MFDTETYQKFLSKIGLRESFFGLFIIVSVFIWIISEHLVVIYLYIPGYEVVDIFLFDRLKKVMAISTILIFGLILFCIYVTREMIRAKSVSPVPVISQETVTDLMLSREQFRKLYDNSPVPYFMMDDAGNIRNPNRASLRFFGGTIEECTNANFFSLIEEEADAEQTMSLLRVKVERSVPVSQEEMTMRPLRGEKLHYALVSIYSLERSSPIPFKHLVALVDVSKERENEQAKTDFLLLASHQLRTPLTTVKWYIDYLLSSNKVEMGKMVREYLEEIYVGNERMIELITTLLTVSRIEMGTLSPTYKSMKIGKVIEDVLEELAPDIQKHGTRIQVLSDGDDDVVMDYTMIRIVIHNLLTNAIKYTPNTGTVIIDSKFNPHAFTLSVTDTGYGIPIDEQDKIFKKMYRASNAKKISTNGTGLGLYMSKAFVEKLGGRLVFNSKPEKGSTFTITMPRVAPDA